MTEEDAKFDAAFPGARRFAAALAGEGDDKARRGAEGAARQVYNDLRERGVDTDYDTVRERVNVARRRVAAKKKNRR